MDDERVWGFEASLWTASPEHYRHSIDDECLMALPSEPHLLKGSAAVDAVSRTPRWTEVELTDRQVSRPQEGLIIVSYTAHAKREGVQPYMAYCTSTYRRIAHEVWKVVQHSQVPPLMLGQG